MKLRGRGFHSRPNLNGRFRSSSVLEGRVNSIDKSAVNGDGDGSGAEIFSGSGWRAFTFSARGDWFAAVNIRSNAAYVFDRTLTNCVAEMGPHSGTDAVAISPEKRWVVTGSGRDGQARLWDVSNLKEVLVMPVGAKPRAAFSADGKWLATFGERFELRRTGSWRREDPRIVEHRPALGAAAFSPQGRLLAVVSEGANVQLVDLATFRPLGCLQSPGPIQINALAFSPDGARLVAACVLGRVRIWDLNRLRERLREVDLDWHLEAEQ